jgi:hypothetical protein
VELFSGLHTRVHVPIQTRRVALAVTYVSASIADALHRVVQGAATRVRAEYVLATLAKVAARTTRPRIPQPKRAARRAVAVAAVPNRSNRP